MDINVLMSYIGGGNREAGWHDRYLKLTQDGGDESAMRDHVITKLMLAVSELVEAVEELRDGRGLGEKYYRTDGKPEGFGVEVADAIIRLLDLAYMTGLPIEDLIMEKVQFNKSRGVMHGGKKV